MNYFVKPGNTTLTLHLPIGKQKRYTDLELTVLDAKEVDKPTSRPAIYWKLLTDLPVDDPKQAGDGTA